MMAVDGRRNRDSLLALLIATGDTYERAAAAAGLSERTVRRRMQDESFRRLVHRTQQELMSRLQGELLETASQASRTLRELLSADQPPTTRLGAARAVLDGLLRFREHVELEHRLTALEERFEAQR